MPKPRAPEPLLGDNPFEEAPPVTEPPSDSDASDVMTSSFQDRDHAPDAGLPEPIASKRWAEPGPTPYEEVFGVEAAVPPRDYGPPIPSILPDPRAITNEIRELERRVRARLTPAFPIEARRHLPLAALWKRYRKFTMRDRSDVIDEFGRDPNYRARIEPALDLLYRKYFRVDTTGLQNVPSAGRALVVANHSGTLPWDGAILMHAMRHEHPAHRDLRPLVEDFVFHFPYLGVFMNRIGCVRACQDNAEKLLTNDQLVAVFPEGAKGIGKLYKNRYKLQRFGRGGFIKLALRTQSPIVPLAIVGAEETHPMLAKVTWFAKSIGIPYVPVTPTFPLLGPAGLLPLPSKWSLHFGEPIDLSKEHGPDAAQDRILVNRLAEQVRSQIQEMLNASLAQRGSGLF